MLVSLCRSATLRAKKEYRQKTEQRPAGRKPRPPPSRSAPVTPPTHAFTPEAPQNIIEEEDEEGYVP